MAEREKKLNNCRHCNHPFEWHNPVTGCPGQIGQQFEEARVFRASPSSVKTFKGCVRKWASKALGGIKKPPTQAQADGTELHTYAETYLATGIVPDQTKPMGRLFVEGIPFLPKRRLEPHEIEGECSFEFGGVPWIGYYDWKEFDIQLIGDHKTSSDPKKWGLTAVQLPDDIQAAVYAWDSGWDETDLKWLYYAKKAKNAYPVQAKISREHARQVLDLHAPIAREMQTWFNAHPELLTVEALNEIPCDPSECSFVGRNCDFGDRCTLIKPQSLVRENVGDRTRMANEKVEALKAKLAAKKNGGTVNPPEVEGALAETLKEVKNDPSDPPAQAPGQKEAEPKADAAVETKTAETPKAEKPVKEPKAKADKPAPATAPAAAADGYVSVMVPRGAQVVVTFLAE